MSTTETLPERTHRAVLIRWGERASAFHDEDPGRSYRRDEIRMPRRDVSLTLNHDGPVIGLVSSFAVTDDGLEGVIKLGHRGEELLRQGYSALSPEITDTGELVGVALAVANRPAFRSARVIETISFASTGSRTFIEERSTPTAFHVASPIAPDVAAVMPTDPEAEIEAARRRFAERRLELQQQDIADEEQRLIAALIPADKWPKHLPGYQRWQALQMQEAARAVLAEGEVAAAAFAERMTELELRARRRRWWRFR